MRTVEELGREWVDKNKGTTCFNTGKYADQYTEYLEQRVLELEGINEILKRNQCEYPQDHDFR